MFLFLKHVTRFYRPISRALLALSAFFGVMAYGITPFVPAYASTPSPWHVDSHQVNVELRIACPSTTYCVSVGMEGFVEITSNGGISWTSVSSLQLGGASLGIACPSVTVCYLAGEINGGAGVIEKSSNGGLSWSSVTIPSGIEYLASISCPSPNICYAAGSTGTTGVVVGTSNGTTWTTQPIASGVGPLSGISCLNISTCVSVGATSGGVGEAIVTSNAGAGWSSISIPLSTQLSSVYCIFAGSFCQAVGWHGGSAFAMGTTNSGLSWSAEVVPGGPVALNDVSCASSTQCMAVDSNGFVLTTSNSGSTWSSDPVLPPGVAGYFGVSCPSSTQCFTLGESLVGVGQVNETTNFGSSWQTLAFPGALSWLAISCPSSSNCVAVGTSVAGGVIEYTNNGGSSWTTVYPSGGVADLYGVSCASNLDCQAVGDLTAGGAVALSTSSGGATWTPDSIPSALTQLTGVSCLDSQHCFASDASGQVAVTSNGTSWTIQPTPLSYAGVLYAISCTSTSVCVAVGSEQSTSEGAIEETLNGGATWTNSLLTSGPSGATGALFLSVSCVLNTGTTSCQAVGSVSSGAIGESTSNLNSSTTWNAENLPTGLNGLNSVSCVSPSACSAVDATGAILGTSDGGITWSQESGPFFASNSQAVSCVTPSQCWATSGGAILATMADVSSVSPSSGPPSGGNSVTISGSGFSGATAVNFGGASATFSVINDSTIQATVPSGTSGIVDVTVTNTVGTSVLNSNDTYLYVTPGVLYSMSPVRVCDTRPGALDPPTYAGKTLQPGVGLSVVVVGANGDGVPANASAIVANITAVAPSNNGYLTVFPSGTTEPLASSLNFSANEIAVANLVQIPIGTNGAITVISPISAVDVIVDVEGYIAPAITTAGLFNPVAPTRIVDTRNGAPSNLQDTNHFVTANSTINVQATGFGGVPLSGVEAVAVNITVTDTIGSGFLVAYPSNSTSSSSTLNFTAGQSVPNRAIVSLSPTGGFTIEVARAGADVIVDVNGWYTNSQSSTGYQFHPVSPVRIADSRTPTNPPLQLAGSTFAAFTSQSIQVSGYGGDGVPSGAYALDANVTVTDTYTPGFGAIYPSNVTLPSSSDLNWSSGETVPNCTIVELSPTGGITIYVNAPADVVVDVNGWYG